jgi:glycosyltransferase involved in cell wall biosynthesis
MKILHTEWMGTRGGQAIRVIEDLKLIKELGFTPFLAAKPNEWLYNEAVKENIIVFPITFSHIADMNSLYKLYKIIKDNQIDIVHTHSSKDSYISTLAAKIAGVKVVRSRHIELTKKAGIIYKIADFVITTGEKVKDELLSSGVSQEKVMSIPTYPNEKKFKHSDKIRKEMQIKYKTQKMLIIGTMTGLHVRKRPLSLIPIMREVVLANPNVKLLIAGQKFDDQMEKLNNLIAKYNLERNVEFVGYVNPEEFLNVIDIYICPSEKEGVPQALMQAMMMHKAAVSTDVGSIKDLNINNNLIIVDKDNMKTLETSLIELVVDDELREELALKNDELMHKYCSRSVMKQKMKTVYENLYNIKK